MVNKSVFTSDGYPIGICVEVVIRCDSRQLAAKQPQVRNPGGTSGGSAHTFAA